MNIAVIAKTRFPIKQPFSGGLESFTYMICEEYQKLGHEVTLYAHADSDKRFNIVSFYGEEKRRDSYSDIYEGDEYLSIIRDIESKDFDIVHNNSTHHIPILWGARAPIPVVTTLHTPPYTKLKAAASLASYSENLHFVAVSKSLEKTWRPYINTRLSVIYNGIDQALWPLTRKNNDYLFWYGRIIKNKGLDIALDAAHAVGLPLHFAGPVGDEKYYQESVLPRMEKDDTYLGHLTQEKIHEAMTGAAAMVNSVRWEEPFGLSIIEAMAAGVPIAGFDRGAFRELISEKSGVIANGTTVSSLAEAIESATKLDSKRVSECGAAYPLRAVANQYIKHFEELL